MKPPEEVLDELCPRCPEEGREPGHLVVKLGRYGRFIGCQNYPECKYTRPMEASGARAGAAGRAVPRVRQARSCDGPAATGRSSDAPAIPTASTSRRSRRRSTGVTCPKCKQGEMVERRGRFGPFYSCERYPECDFSRQPAAAARPVPGLPGLVVEARGGATRCTACGKAWAADGAELSEEEAKALVPEAAAGAAEGEVGRDSESGSKRQGRPRARAKPGRARRSTSRGRALEPDGGIATTELVATVAEEIAALRGTKPAGLKDLLTHPSFSRLWRAMLVSSLGDWVGFVAVATLVAYQGGKRLAGPGRRRRHAGPAAARRCCSAPSPACWSTASTAGKVMVGGRHRARRPVRDDAVPAPGSG